MSFDDDFKVADVGPEDAIQEEPPENWEPQLPKPRSETVVTVELSDEIKQEIAINFEVGERKLTNARDIRKSENKAKYLIEDLLTSNGLLFIGGASGTGKTILACQFAGDLIEAKPTMTFQIGEHFKDKHLKVLIISLEMNHDDLQIRLNHMYPNPSEEVDKLQAENLIVYCEPEPFELWNAAHVIELIRIIKTVEPDMVLIDSASIAFADDLTNPAQVKASISNIYKIRTRLDVAFTVVAHTRKPNQGVMSNPEETTLSELMGVAGIGQAATGILIMVEDEEARKATIKGGSAYQDEKIVWLVNAKSRFGANAGAFRTQLTSKKDVDNSKPLMFRRRATPIEMTQEAKKKQANPTKADAEALKDAFGQIDFGPSPLDGND